MNRFFLIAFFFFGLVGCQSKVDALNVVCDAPIHPDVQKANPANRAMMIAKHIESNVSNAEVKQMFSTFGEIAPEARQKILKTALDAEGISKCKILEVWSPKQEVK